MNIHERPSSADSVQLRLTGHAQQPPLGTLHGVTPQADGPAGVGPSTTRTGPGDWRPGAQAASSITGEGVGLAVPRVVGLDVSISSTGLADFWNGQTTTKTILTRPTGNHLPATAQRLRGITREICDHISFQGPYPALVLIEGPSYNSRGTGSWDRAGLWWMVVDYVLGTGRPLALVPPAVLKKYATGRGNADKTAMAVALQRRFGLELGDDNKVDAFWLAVMGLDHLGHPPVVMPQAHRDALAKVRWPEVSRG